mgnify:FL=1
MPTITFDHVTINRTVFSSEPATDPSEARPILDDISLTLNEPRIGIIGANGSGKSSLVRCINGLTTPSSGSVTVDDLNVSRSAKKVRRKVGFLFSNADNQIIMPTVAEDVSFSLRRHRLSRQEKAQRVTEALAGVGLKGKEDQSPHTLSGGEKQLLALASILVLEPEVIIADEPTTLLDLRNRQKIGHIFDSLSQQLIIVTHDLDLLDSADRVLCIDAGRVADDSNDSGAPQAVVQRYVERMTECPE